MAPRFDVIFALFLRSANVQRKRAFLTIAAIAWGSLALLLLLSFGEGLTKSISGARAAMGSNIAVIWFGSTTRPWQGLPEGRNIRPTYEDVPILRSQLQGHAGVVGELRRWGVTLTNGRTTLNGQVTGANWEFGELRNQIARQGGRFLNAADEAERKRVIFLGNDIAQRLFPGDTPEGKTLYVNQVPYTVIGVLDKRLQMGNYSGPDDNRTVIPITTFASQFGRRYLENLVIRAPDAGAMAPLLERFREVAGRKFGFDPKDDRVLGIWNTIESSKVMNNMVKGVAIFLSAMGGLTLFVGGIGVANIMYAVVKERTREIGVMMAIGARPGWITGPLVLEAMTFTLMGGFIGLMLALALILAMGAIPTEGNEALAMLGKPQLSLRTGLGAAGILGLIGFMAGYIPARRAARIDPAQTLRYE